MNTTPAPAYLTAAEDAYDRMCRDEDATPAQITLATDELHAAQAVATVHAADALDDDETGDQLITEALEDTRHRGFDPARRLLQDLAVGRIRARLRAARADTDAQEQLRGLAAARWITRRCDTAEPLQLHAEVPGLGWAVPVHAFDASHVLEHGRLALLVTRPAPGTLPAPIEL